MKKEKVIWQKLTDPNTNGTLELYHSLFQRPSKSSGVTGGSGATGATSSKKKRKDRESFKNGGTWPRTRGGPVIQHPTGTILHPHKYKVSIQ